MKMMKELSLAALMIAGCQNGTISLGKDDSNNDSGDNDGTGNTGGGGGMDPGWIILLMFVNY